MARDVNNLSKKASMCGIALLIILLFPIYASAISDKEKMQIDQYESILKQAAMDQGVPLALLKTIMYIESRGKADSVSCTGAVGPFQFVYDTAKGLFPKDVESKITSCSCKTGCGKSLECTNHDCPSTDPRFDIVLSSKAAAKMLKYLLDKYEGNLFLVALAYNRGEVISSYIKDKIGTMAAKEKIQSLVRESVNVYCKRLAKPKCLGQEWPSKEKEIADQGINYMNEIEKYFVDFGGFSAASSDSAYYVNPSFKQYVPYNMSMFDKIKEEAKILIECKNEPKKKECIDSKLKEFNKDNSIEWSQDCEKGYEKIFYDFVYNMELCSKSMYDLNKPGCMCKFSMGYGDSSINNLYTIKISNSFNGMLFTLMNPKDKALSEQISTASLIGIQDQSFKFPLDMKKGPAIMDYQDIVFSINYIRPFLALIIPSKMCYGYNKCSKDNSGCDICESERALDTINSYDVYVYKSGNKLAFISSDKYFRAVSITGGYDKLEECKPPLKVEYAFCAKDKTSELFNYDKATDTGGYTNPTVRFALSFKDDIAPPAVEKISTSDALKAENKFTVTFDTPMQKNAQTSADEYIPDLFYYNIYCSWKDLNARLPEINSGTTALQPVAQQLAEQKPANTVTIDKCYDRNNKLEDVHDIPYSTDQSLLSYYVAVQPVDLSDNKAPVNIAVPATPIDDLSPDGSIKGGAAISHIKGSGFSYLIPTNNSDSSPIREDETLFPEACALKIGLIGNCGDLLSILEKGTCVKAPPRKLSQLPKKNDGNYDLEKPEWWPFFSYNDLGLQKGDRFCIVAFVRDAAGNPKNSDSKLRELVYQQPPIIAG